jgi:hypothetical protein
VRVGAGVVGAGVVGAGRAVVGATVGGAVVGAAVVGAGVVGGGEVGATVARTVGGGEVGDGEALALGEDDAEVGAMRAPPRNTTPITRTVMRLPATAASARSIQRGPLRRGGGMILVVSPAGSCVMGQHSAHAVPPEVGQALVPMPAGYVQIARCDAFS